MRIIVTGGLGFIGSHCVEQLIQRGDEVLILDKMTYAGKIENISHLNKNDFDLVITDIADWESLQREVKSFGNVDVVFNFAAESHVDRSISDSSPFISSNIVGAVNIFELTKMGLVDRVIQVSTDEVYGSIDLNSWVESSPLDPRSPYSASKASAELFAKAYRNTFQSQILISRCANNYGSRQALEKFIPSAIKSCLSNKSINVYGDGMNRREWIHVSDHVKGLIRMIDADSVNNYIFNFGGIEYSNLEIASMILERFDMNAETGVNYVTDRLGHDRRYSVDDSLAREFLHWEPKMDFKNGLFQTVDWYVENIGKLT
jgi:dTDP-glucose 4,6-dehydratase